MKSEKLVWCDMQTGFISNRFSDRETVLPDSAFSPVRRLTPFFPLHFALEH